MDKFRRTDTGLFQLRLQCYGFLRGYRDFHVWRGHNRLRTAGEILRVPGIRPEHRLKVLPVLRTGNGIDSVQIPQMHVKHTDLLNLKRRTVQIDGIADRIGVTRFRLLHAVFGAFHIQPFAAFLFLDCLLHLLPVTVCLFLGGERPDCSVLANIDFIPDVIPHGKAALGLNDFEAFIGRLIGLRVGFLRSFQYRIDGRIVPTFKLFPDGSGINIGEIVRFLHSLLRGRFTGRGKLPIGVLHQRVPHTGAGVRVIVEHPHEVRILNRQGGTEDGGMALCPGIVRIRVHTGIAVCHVSEDKLPHRRVKLLIGFLRRHGKSGGFFDLRFLCCVDIGYLFRFAGEDET